MHAQLYGIIRMWRQYVIVFYPALVVDINEEIIPLVYYYVSRSSPRRPARGRPLLRIFSLRQLPGSLYRYQNPSRRLMHGCLIVVLAPSVDYPFSGGSRQVALPPLVGVYKGCIKHGFGTGIVSCSSCWEMSFVFEELSLQHWAVKDFSRFASRTWSARSSCFSRLKPPRKVHDYL